MATTGQPFAIIVPVTAIMNNWTTLNSKCEFLTTEEVNNLYLHGDEEELRKMSVYQVENSFNRLKMGSNPYGIYMCTPMDVMHGLQHGIIKYVLEVLMSNMNTSQKSLLDRLAITFNVSSQAISTKVLSCNRFFSWHHKSYSNNLFRIFRAFVPNADANVA
jgi:hypothetical protein